MTTVSKDNHTVRADATAPGTILLVDDDSASRWLLAAVLRKARYQVTECADGRLAVDLVKDGAFDLIILDLVMPGVDGFETLARIRSTHDEAALPVIVVTVSDTRDDVVRCLDLGANDYVTKPVDWPILMARIRALLSASRAARREVAIGAEIQKALLIGTPSTSMDGLEVGALTIPSRRVDGDFYEFYEHGDDVVDVIVGDVMGKGIPAALLGAATKKAFGHALAHFLARRRGAELPRLERIVEFLNARMGAQLLDLRVHVALSVVRLDLHARTFSLVDCGHTELLHWQHAEKRVVKRGGESMPLGFGVEDRFAATKFSIQDGDLLFLYTDGLSEARGANGEILGLEPVIAQIERHAGESPAALLSAIEGLLREFCPRSTFDDDVTCVVLKVGGRSDSAGSRTIRQRFPSHPDSLRLVRNVFRDVMCYHDNGDRHPEGDALELATNEVAANIIEHAHFRDPTRFFEVMFRLRKTELEITFRYEGSSFDPSSVPRPLLDGAQESGYGLFIVEQVVHSVSYVSLSTNEQIIRLTHRL